MSFKKLFRRGLRKIGFDLVRYSSKVHPLARRMKLIESYKINHVLDVGANKGQYAARLRELGYMGKITSFEPTSDAYSGLYKVSKNDKLWSSYNYALGNETRKSTINIARNSYSSSLLGMLPRHVSSAPESEYITTENIEIKPLDDIFGDLVDIGENVYLKIDTQGYEDSVLRGAKKSLDQIATIQLEMSLVELYEGEMLFDEMYNKLHNMGYQLVSLEPGFSDGGSGQLLQVDGIFHRL